MSGAASLGHSAKKRVHTRSIVVGFFVVAILGLVAALLIFLQHDLQHSAQGAAPQQQSARRLAMPPQYVADPVLISYAYFEKDDIQV